MSKNLFSFGIVLTFSIILFQSQANAGWFQGKPAPELKSFWICEASWKKSIINADDQFHKGRWLLTSEIGFMKNLDSISSLGGTAYLGLHEDGTNFGLKARYRKWLSVKSLVSMDYSLGLLLYYSDNRIQQEFPGFIGAITINFRDLLAFTIQQELVKYSVKDDYFLRHGNSKPGFRKTTYLGIQVGSYIALPFFLIVLAVLTFDLGSGPIISIGV